MVIDYLDSARAVVDAGSVIDHQAVQAWADKALLKVLDKAPESALLALS